MNRKDADNKWYFERCREVQRSPNGHIDLWAREHGKSSVITMALTIFDIINDPEITVGIFSHTRPIAKAFLKQIKREFEGNEKLKGLFPEIFWENVNDSPQWSEDGGITVKRKGNTKEATVEAWGLVDGQPTGRHFKLRVYDDVVTRENVTTPEQIQKTTEAFELSDNLGMQGGKVRIIGTRYHLNDTYASILQRDIVTARIYPATSNGRMDGKPVLFSQEEWERKLKTQSRKIVAAQLLQNPLADEDARFQPLWLSSYEIRPRTLNVCITVDPSLGKSSTSDSTAIAVIGYAKGGAKYLLDGYCHRMTLSQRWAYLRDLYLKWSKEYGVTELKVGYERYGCQTDLQYIEERMEIEKIVFPIKEINWVREGGQSKVNRIERLEPDFRNRRFLLPNAIIRNGKPMTWKVCEDSESKDYQCFVWKDFQGLTKKQLQYLETGQDYLLAKAIKRLDNEKQTYDLTARFIEQYLSFPFGSHDDLLDTVSRVYDMDMLEPMIYHNPDLPTYFDS